MQIVHNYVKQFRESLQKNKEMASAGLVLMRYIKKIRFFFTSYFEFLDLDNSHKFYFHKEQLSEFEEIASNCLHRMIKIENLYKRNDAPTCATIKRLQQMITAGFKNYCKPATEVATLRVIDSLDCYLSLNPLLQFLRPTLLSKFLIFRKNESHFYPAKANPLLMRMKK